MEISCKLGNVNLNSCIFNASGVYCKSKENLVNLNNCQNVGAIISKSCTVDIRHGNENPIYWDNQDNLSINSSGLPLG